jgi:hypothetical protein
MKKQAEAISGKDCESYSVSDLSKIISSKGPSLELPKGITLSDCKFTFYQESDSCDENQSGQELSVLLEDNGAGKFLVIETRRWSLDFDEISKLNDILNQVKSIVERSI